MPRSRAPLHLLPAILAGCVALACSACGNSGGATAVSPPAASTSQSSSSAPADTNSQTTTETSTAPALPGTGKPAITIGDKNYTEQFVLGQLYLQALAAQGFNVSLNQNIGPTAVTVHALDTGQLSVYPEYLNVFDSVVAGYTHGFSSEIAADEAAQHYALGHGLQVLAPTPFSDTGAIAVTDAYAAENHLRTVGDLQRIQSSLTIGGPPQFQQSTPGLPDLAGSYGVVPASFKAMAVGDQYTALNNDLVQAADVDTTDGELATGDYALLKDPHRIFGWGNVVPVVSAKALAAEGPAFVQTLDRVDAALNIDTIRQMNQAVDLAQQDPAAVAKQFLQTHGLLTPLPAF